MTFARRLLMSIGLGSCIAYSAVHAGSPVTLDGRWRLNTAQSDFPKEIGFGIDVGHDTDSSSSGRSGGTGRGGGRHGGSGAGGTFGGPSSTESEEDVNKVKELIAGARNPPTLLTISQTGTRVTVTDGLDRSLTIHPNGNAETVRLDGGPVRTTSTWTDHQLTILYLVEEHRRFRYVYSRLPSGQLMVETQLQRNPHTVDQSIKRTYDPD